MSAILSPIASGEGGSWSKGVSDGGSCAKESMRLGVWVLNLGSVLCTLHFTLYTVAAAQRLLQILDT